MNFIYRFFLFVLFFSFSLFAQDAVEKKEEPPVEKKATKAKKELRIFFTEGDITKTRLVPITDDDDYWQLSFYGFIKSDYILASDAVTSYSRENLVAPNMAKRQVQFDDSQQRGNISVQETRIGFKSQLGESLRGFIEIDFIDFQKSNPNVNVNPRLRQATLSYDFTKNFGIFFGQRWDIFSPLNPDTYNIINSLFQTGNVGWMREQIGLTFQPTSMVMLSTAIGNSTVNTAAGPSTGVEHNKSPTFAFQMKIEPTKEHTIYLSALTVSLNQYDPSITTNTLPDGSPRPLMYDPSNGSAVPYLAGQVGKSNRIRRQASGVSIGSEHKIASKLKFKWEGNWGVNLANLNTLGIGSAQAISTSEKLLASRWNVLTSSNSNSILSTQQKYNFSSYNRMEVISIEELGGWFSVSYPVTDQWELGMLAGGVRISNPEDLRPAFDNKNLRDFSFAQVDPADGRWGANQLGPTVENTNIGYNVTYKPISGVRFFFQHEYMQTFYHDAERNKGIFAHIKNVDVETGVITLKHTAPAYSRASAKASSHVARFGAIFNF
jgi:hypothetical protein